MFKEKIGAPAISVVTVVFNGGLYLEECIQSVLNQTYGSIEYLVIDGGSTDNSVDIIKKHGTGIDFWISEPDGGISDAMNKGISYASGEYIFFLNSDDYFYVNTAVESIVKCLAPKTDILLADILFGQDLVRHKSRNFNFLMNFKMGFSHQGVLCRRGLFKDIGGFDNIFKIDMDYDFFLRAYRSGVEVRQCNEILSVMRDTGISSRLDWDSLSTRFDEEKLLHKKNCNSMAMKVFYQLYWIVYKPYRKFRYLLKI